MGRRFGLFAQLTTNKATIWSLVTESQYINSCVHIHNQYVCIIGEVPGVNNLQSSKCFLPKLILQKRKMAHNFLLVYFNYSNNFWKGKDFLKLLACWTSSRRSLTPAQLDSSHQIYSVLLRSTHSPVFDSTVCKTRMVEGRQCISEKISTSRVYSKDPS